MLAPSIPVLHFFSLCSDDNSELDSGYKRGFYMLTRKASLQPER